MKVDFYTKGLLLLISIFLGIIAFNCCTANTSFNIEPMTVQAAGKQTDRKFQYKAIRPGTLDFEPVLNQYGEQGWEFVGTVHNGSVFVFKKQ